MKRTRETRLVVCMMCIAGVAVLAGGAKVTDQSTRAMGMMDAFVAGADDASSIYYNPAGLTALDGPQFITNFYIAHGTTYADTPGGKESSDGRVYFIPTMYYAAPVRGLENTVAGIGVYSPFGLGAKWADNLAKQWVQGSAPPAMATKLAEIQMADVNAVIAHKVTDTLSIGVGIDYYDSRVINRFEMNYGVAQEEVDMDADGHAWGYNIGLQWQCTEDLRLGITCRSEFEVDYKGSVKYKDVPAGFGPPEQAYDADIDIEYPWSVAAGVSWQATPKLRLELAAEWMEWSSWDTQVLETGGSPFTGPANLVTPTELDWDNSWILMLGGEYELNEKWTLRGGYGYNQTPVPTSTADVQLPADTGHAIGFGATYRWNENLSLDGGVIVSYAPTRTLDNSSAPAGTDFDTVSTFYSIGLVYSF